MGLLTHLGKPDASENVLETDGPDGYGKTAPPPSQHPPLHCKLGVRRGCSEAKELAMTRVLAAESGLMWGFKEDNPARSGRF